MAPVRRLLGSFGARLVLAFGAVVAIALALVLASLPRLLDGYFAEQERDNLEDRTRVVASLVAEQLIQYRDAAPDRRPLLFAGDPPQPSATLRRALGDPEQGYVHELAEELARADVQVAITSDADDGGQVAYELRVPLADGAGQPGQQREQLSSRFPFLVEDLFWSQTDPPVLRVTVTLSDPFSFRAQTLDTIVGVMFGAAALALPVAVLASLLLAHRLTDPVRRLTEASRSLAEGRLDTRVPVTAGGATELADLAVAFNVMADRVAESIGYISRDRDRSREFLADVSHELRTPIAALRTFNELLRDGAAADPQTRAEFLEQSQQQIERLDWLAQNLLELSKLDSGLVHLDLRPDDLRAVAEDAVAQAEPVAARKGVELRIQLPSEPVRVPHDPPRMGQVISNLIGNAVKFTPAGGRVEVGVAPDPGGAVVTVTDTGTGIDPDELPHVFERFYRGTQRPELRASGSGLGLSIVRSIVDMHHGRVTIESTPGRGTVVAVRIPAETPPEPPAPGPVSVSSPAPSRA
jgi:signal transduction histidine kinase